ncbi:MAG: hypothetical protein VW493_08080 [Gammaproteobacteria bacterium]
MTSNLIFLSATYAFVLFVLLLILARAKSAFALRLVIIALAGVSYIVHFFSLDQLRGWPTTAALPEHFTLKAWSITEPNPSTETAGRIDLWIQAEPAGALRAHTLSYSSALHQELENAGERIQQGYRQQGATKGSGTVEFSDAPRRLPEKKGSD